MNVSNLIEIRVRYILLGSGTLYPGVWFKCKAYYWYLLFCSSISSVSFVTCVYLYVACLDAYIITVTFTSVNSLHLIYFSCVGVIIYIAQNYKLIRVSEFQTKLLFDFVRHWRKCMINCCRKVMYLSEKNAYLSSSKYLLKVSCTLNNICTFQYW
jgi:hypothetical protein